MGVCGTEVPQRGPGAMSLLWLRLAVCSHMTFYYETQPKMALNSEEFHHPFY